MKWSAGLLLLSSLALPASVLGSGFGVFTQGASGLGQANAVVAHPTGPSSLYFNPALLNDVPGTQVEVGTTAILARREFSSSSTGLSESADDIWKFPSTFYLTHQVSDDLSAGIGMFFPFGLANEWDDTYEGRYLGTRGEIFTTNVNPVVSWRLNEHVSLAAGLDFVYFDAELRSMINQTAVGIALSPPAGFGPLPDVEQTFSGDDWGYGYNLGALIKFNEQLSFGAAYRSHVDLEVEGDVEYRGTIPAFSPLFPETGGQADIRLPQQFTAGLAYHFTDALVAEVGVRWEDWASTDQLRIKLNAPVLSSSTQVVPRDWHSTWAYNIGGQFRVNQALAVNAGYLYGQDAVPGSTFEPMIPDSDAHLFTLGADLDLGLWTVSGAFGYEYHESRDKQNVISDPLGSLVAGIPVNTANGEYETDIYLLAVSVGYRF